MKLSVCLLLFTALVVLPSQKAFCSDIYSLIGTNDAILVTDSNEKIIFAKNNSRQLVPASILKLLSSLSALHYLGKDYRFKTEFFLNSEKDLTIKGYGDPLLISEIITQTAKDLSTVDSLKNIIIKDIILDNSYFTDEAIPGAAKNSNEPYDAQTGALSVNFNTINFNHDLKGRLMSAEDQTPLLPFIIKRIEQSGLVKGRIILSGKEKEIYPGYLFKHFLNENNIRIKGRIKTGKRKLNEDKLVYTYYSEFSIAELVSKLLEFSNNFIANQLFLAIGTKAYGPPARLAKGIKATLLYTNHLAKNNGRIKDYTLVEGSGLSRSNRISADAMDAILKEFAPYRHLMRKGENEFYKTGTLTGISTRAGYIFDSCKKSYRYIIMCNSPDKSSEKILRAVQAELEKRINPGI